MTNKVYPFPLNDNKQPAIKTDWHDWRGEASSSLVGLMIPRGLLVVDVDTYKGVKCSDIDAALGCALPWANASLQKTRSGGMHYAFRVPVDREIPNGSNVLGVKGFDTRSAGRGYIATGEGYEDLSLLGVRESLESPELWPWLPETVVAKLCEAGGVIVGADDDVGLLVAISSQPLDISFADVTRYVERLGADVAGDSDMWLKVGMGIYHQTCGSSEGWALFDEFSRKAPDSYDLRENRNRWDSFGRGGARSNPVTFASVIHLGGGAFDSVEDLDEFADLREQASRLDSLDDYAAFKVRVSSVSARVLGDDLRAMLAADVYESFGKTVGVTKSEIKKALKPKRDKSTDVFNANMPQWLQGWVYVEVLCEFANVDLNYSIKREAFNAKYDRTDECLAAECQASQLALVIHKIPVVVDSMFWPTAEQVFTHEGKLMLNSYHKSGCEAIPESAWSDGDKNAITLFLRHIDLTLSDEREKTILLDWLSYVVRNIGQRINWALLLQGCQGTGKSYFVVLLQHILGRHVTNLDPTAITGRFTGWAQGSLVVAVEEIRVSGTNRYEVLDRMKPFFTNETVQIEEKGRNHRTVANFTNYLLLTNHKDAIPFGEDDRRYCVLFSRMQSEGALSDELGGDDAVGRYFEDLFGSAARHAGAIFGYLKERSISADFKPKGRAPVTAAKREMAMLTHSPDRLSIEDAIANHRCEVVGDTLLDVTYLRDLVIADGNDWPNSRTVSAVLLELGYSKMEEGKGRVKIAKDQKYHYVWTKQPSDCRGTLEKIKEYFDGGGDFIPF